MKFSIKNTGRILTIALFAVSAAAGALSILMVDGAMVARAADTSSKYQLLAPLPCIESATVKCGGNGTLVTNADFRGYIQYLFNLLIALAAVAAVFMIVWGGFTYMTTDSFYKKEEGLEKVRHAVYGLLLILCSYLILRTVDPRLTQISDTLVPPLLNSSGQPLVGNNDALVNQITGLSQTTPYDASNAALKQEASQASTAISNAQQTLSNINAQMLGLGCDSGPNNDSACAGLQAQKQQALDQISSNTAQLAVSQATQVFNSYLANGATGSPTVTDLQNSLNQTTNAFTAAASTLEQNNSATQSAALLSSYNYTQGVLKAQLDVTQAQGTLTSNATVAQDLSDLQYIQTNLLPKVQDPTQKAQLQAQLTSDITTLTAQVNRANQTNTSSPYGLH